MPCYDPRGQEEIRTVIKDNPILKKKLTYALVTLDETTRLLCEVSKVLTTDEIQGIPGLEEWIVNHKKADEERNDL